MQIEVFLSALCSLAFASSTQEVLKAVHSELKFTTTFHIPGRGSKCLPVVLPVFNLDRIGADLMSLYKVSGQITSSRYYSAASSATIPPALITRHPTLGF